ncbi:hypothetical protein [Ligilactobacillus equi]|nr:hypothetical protein [Ligilactobacillus equi]
MVKEAIDNQSQWDEANIPYYATFRVDYMVIDAEGEEHQGHAETDYTALSILEALCAENDDEEFEEACSKAQDLQQKEAYQLLGQQEANQLLGQLLEDKNWDFSWAYSVIENDVAESLADHIEYENKNWIMLDGDRIVNVTIK